MNLCSECGSENEDINKFCSGCGAVLVTFNQVISEKEKQIKKFKLVTVIMIVLLMICLIIVFNSLIYVFS